MDKSKYSTNKLSEGNIILLDHHQNPYTKIGNNYPGKNKGGIRKN